MSHPAPIVTCRAATPEETPRNARSLAKAAAEHGWRHRLTYAKGTTIDRAGEPGKIVESIVLRLRHDIFAGVACWHDGKFAFAWAWSKVTRPHRIGAREFAAFIKAVQP